HLRRLPPAPEPLQPAQPRLAGGRLQLRWQRRLRRLPHPPEQLRQVPPPVNRHRLRNNHPPNLLLPRPRTNLFDPPPRPPRPLPASPAEHRSLPFHTPHRPAFVCIAALNSRDFPRGIVNVSHFSFARYRANCTICPV